MARNRDDDRDHYEDGEIEFPAFPFEDPRAYESVDFGMTPLDNRDFDRPFDPMDYVDMKMIGRIPHFPELGRPDPEQKNLGAFGGAQGELLARGPQYGQTVRIEPQESKEILRVDCELPAAQAAVITVFAFDDDGQLNSDVEILCQVGAGKVTPIDVPVDYGVGTTFTVHGAAFRLRAFNSLPAGSEFRIVSAWISYGMGINRPARSVTRFDVAALSFESVDIPIMTRRFLPWVRATSPSPITFDVTQADRGGAFSWTQRITYTFTSPVVPIELHPQASTLTVTNLDAINALPIDIEWQQDA